MYKHKISIVILSILVFSIQSTAQIPYTIHARQHNSLSLQLTRTPIKFVHGNTSNISSAANGVQLRYVRHFPLSTLYSLGIGIYTGHNTYKFNKPYDELGHLNTTQISGAFSQIHSDDSFNQRFSIDNFFSFASIGFPIYISGVFPISKHLLLIASMGLNINGILHLDVYHNHSLRNKSVIQTGSTELTIIRTDPYLETNPQLGFFIEFGPQYTFRNGTIFSASFTGNLNLVTQQLFKYDLYPGLEEYKSSGFMETSGSYFGLSIDYIFIKFLRR